MTSSDLLYTRFFEFDERPFTLVPDPDFLYWSPQHKRAYSVLEFGIMSKAPITLVTGEIGAGKTTLVQALLGGMSDDVTIGLISNAQGGRGELIQWILNALGVSFEPGLSYVRMFQTLQDFLLAEYAAGRRSILIVDEAQNLSIEGLEELRMLTNINSNKDVLVQLMLVGQPELRDLVQDARLRQLAQRISASFHLQAMDVATIGEYIRHRLKKAGGTGEEFTDVAFDLIHRETGGVPRLLNQLCEFALLYAWAAESRVVDEAIVRQVIEEKVFFGGASTAAAEEPEDETPDMADDRHDDVPVIQFRKNSIVDG